MIFEGTKKSIFFGLGLTRAGLSVPDSSMLIILANELDTTVSELLGEPVVEPTTDDLKILSEKLEVINLQLAKRSITKVKTIRWILISLCAVIVVIFIALASTNNFYLNWNYNDPELAVAGTILHGFEFLFVRLAQDREKNSLPSFDSCPFLWTAHRFLPIEQNRVTPADTVWSFNRFPSS